MGGKGGGIRVRNWGADGRKTAAKQGSTGLQNGADSGADRRQRGPGLVLVWRQTGCKRATIRLQFVGLTGSKGAGTAAGCAAK